MALDWQTFKSGLGLSSGTSVFYIDDEGSKIPIGSECEFQEALRLARMSNNSLKLIFSGDKLKPNEMLCENLCQSVENPVEKCVEVKLKSASAMSQSLGSKENGCNCRGDVAPEWFTQYMKKFKKEVVHELKSYIHDTVHSAIKKKLSSTKSETADLLSERNDPMFYPICTHAKKKKKSSERDSIDIFMDQRQLRLPKKLNATKPERLEMLDQKTKALLEEKRRLLESRHHSRSKLEKNCCMTVPRIVSPVKSAYFLPPEMCLTVEPESEFSVPVTVQNNGWLQWRSPQLVCFEVAGISLREYKKSLPKICPRENCCVEVSGKLSPGKGPHYFRCHVVDRSTEIFNPVFICRFDVVPKTVDGGPVTEAAPELRDTVGTLIDFEKDLITSSQKKIEENISEIERRLHDIELLQPSTCPAGKGPEPKERMDADCDLIQLDSGRMQEVKNNGAGYTVPSGVLGLNKINEKEKIPEGVFYRPTHGPPAESSDSDVSIVFVFDEEEEEGDEEDNFFLVPSESPSTAEPAKEDKKSPDAEVDVVVPSGKPTTVRHRKPETKADTPKETRREEAGGKETLQPSPTRCRCSPFGEEISKPKKMKSKSTEYCFTAANLSQPTFTQIPGFFEGRPSRFTFTGEKEETGKSGKIDVPDTDALGRPIYAVKSNGRCLPVKELFEGQDECRPGHSEGQQGYQNRQERRNDRGTDGPPVNTLPNALINGASNVASLAFNTAKSVINNLQSAFVTEGKTEMGEPAYEDRGKPSTEALFKLYEMGYLDFEKNRLLLHLHNNDVTKVINELVRQNENPPDRSL